MNEYKALDKLKKVLYYKLKTEGILKGEYLLGAICINRRGRVLSMGFNSYTKTHPLQSKYANKLNIHHKVYLHAELSALLKSKEKPNSLLVARINRHGQLTTSKPCLVCQLAMREAGVKQVFYVNEKSELILLKESV